MGALNFVRYNTVSHIYSHFNLRNNSGAAAMPRDHGLKIIPSCYILIQKLFSEKSNLF